MSATSQKVLVVDGDDDIRGVIEDLLLDYGYSVSQASSVDEATEWLYRDSFDAVLCHLALLHDADERLARTLEYVRPATRVVAMSASGWIPVEADFDARLAKPFTRAELLEALGGARPAPDEFPRA